MLLVPFQIHDNRGHKISGHVLLEDEFMVFDIRVRKFGLIDQPPETVKAELGLIHDIRFESGLLGGRILIVPKKVEMFHAIPGDHRGQLKLKIDRRYRDDARELVFEVRRRKGERRGD